MSNEPPFNSLGDAVDHYFAEWRRAPFMSTDEAFAMNLLLLSLARLDPLAFTIAAFELGYVPMEPSL